MKACHVKAGTSNDFAAPEIGDLTRAISVAVTGSWVDGHQEGEGTCEYANGTLYEGQWRKGLR